MEILIVLVGYCLFGWLIAKLVFKLTKNSPRKFALRGLALAMIFTPSIVFQHSAGIVPAVTVLMMGPFEPGFGWTEIIWLGMIPILVGWGIAAVLMLEAEARTKEKHENKSAT